MATENQLPQFLRDMLASPPKHGEGVHSWIFRVCRHLHAHRDSEQIFQLIRACIIDCGRFVPDSEIWEAIRNSEKIAWRPGATGAADKPNPPRWPSIDQRQRNALIESGISLYDLWEQSPVRFEDKKAHAEKILPILFPNNPLICVGFEKTKALTDHLSAFAGEFENLQLIVPSPMSKKIGVNQKGEESSRCLDNTGSRRFLVVEFDSGTLDEQACVLSHLARKAPLALVVFSGSKSLHGWFFCAGQIEDYLRSWMKKAVTLGADPATFTRCQFARMPDGQRDNGHRQTVYYLNPGVIKA